MGIGKMMVELVYEYQRRRLGQRQRQRLVAMIVSA
jgi:hypothetical protein